MPDEVLADMNSREWEKAFDEILNEMPDANHAIITENTREFITETAKNVPSRTGNTRSGLIPAWNELGLGGAPFTTLPFGEKAASYQNQRGEWRTIKVKSYGGFKDKRKETPIASFRFYATAAERRWNKKRTKKILKKYMFHKATSVVRNVRDGIEWKWGPHYQRLFDKHRGK
jgi:hypothetical protein